MINLELPWNPAQLAQRIARVHRLGQEKPVRVLNFVTRGSIEERVLRTIEKKQQLFNGLFEGDEDDIAFMAINATTFNSSVRTLLSDAPLPEKKEPETAQTSPLQSAAVALMEALTAFLATNGALPLDLKHRLKKLSE